MARSMVLARLPEPFSDPDWLDETPHCFRATMFSLAKR